MARGADWTVYLIHANTGQIGPQVDIDAGQWDIPLNGTETCSVNVKKTSLPKNIDLKTWMAPWWGGVLLMWRDVPVFAGPIVSRPLEDENNIKLDCAGVRAYLGRRFVAQEFTDWNALPFSSYSFMNLSLGTIAKRYVQASMMKSGGQLPINFPLPDESGPADADHQRNLQGFNIQNLLCDDLLTNIAQVSHGPDIMFKPRLLDDSRFVWDMWTGTANEPRIRQIQTAVWDTTAEAGQTTSLSIVSTGSYETNRVYSVGAGTDQGTLITVSEDLSKVPDGYPLLESAIAISKSPDPAVVKAHGDGVLIANTDMLREITLEVHIDGTYPLGSYWAGDAMDIFTSGWLTFEDGRHTCRLLHMSGDLSRPSSVKLNLQPEKYHGS